MIDDNSINAILLYLKEDFKHIITRRTLLSNLKLHPNVGTILATSDVLTKLGVNNEVVRVNYENIRYLPDSFLYYTGSTRKLSFIKRLNENKYLCDNSYYLNHQDFKNEWSGVVLLISNKNKSSYLPKRWLYWLFVSIWFFLFFLDLKINILPEYFEFFILSFIGFLLSFFAVKIFYGNKREQNSFCDLSSSFNCSTVILSSKKIYKNMGFIDLCILFFLPQFIGLLILKEQNILNSFLFLQKLLLLLSIPVTLLSLFYQTFIIKKWCLLCLGIISILYIQFFYTFFYIKPMLIYNRNLLLALFTLYFGVTIFWFSLKNLFEKYKKSLVYADRGEKIIRNYDIFKFNLLKSDYFPNIRNNGENKILIGNSYSNKNIVIITDPFCSYCQEFFIIILGIYEKYKSKLSIEFRFNFDPKKDNDQSIIYRTLIRAYLTGGEGAFLRVYNAWYENNLVKNSKNINMHKEYIDDILKRQFDENFQYNLLEVPQIIINGYKYPNDYYLREELVFFIDDLIEDTDFA